ncbi:MAG: histidine phosphotransferase [Cyanobacteria bacterium MAG CAR3_bin_5]|nr:histidine phosphotransferase [Cyanobacteria bacterium MAG CAR3_bin_5]
MTSSFPANRITRRRSSAGSSSLQSTSPQSPSPPVPSLQPPTSRPHQARPPLRTIASTSRAPFLTLNDHGRVYVADLPKLSDGQLANLSREAREVFTSLEQRIAQLEADLDTTPRDAVIRACTKRDVTARFMKAIEEEQNSRRTNPQLMAAAGESISRTFMEVARHRLPGEMFDSLLQEAVSLVNQQEEGRQRNSGLTERLPVVISDAPSA